MLRAERTARRVRSRFARSAAAWSATNTRPGRFFKCKACEHQFSVTSGTLFSSRKLPMRDYLMAIATFVNGAKGVSAPALAASRGLVYLLPNAGNSMVRARRRR
jgi:hypothetical protein